VASEAAVEHGSVPEYSEEFKQKIETQSTKYCSFPFRYEFRENLKFSRLSHGWKIGTE